MSDGVFDPARAFAVLRSHGVRFVVIGGIAARLHGSPSITRDLDICYARDSANLDALAAALRAIHATLRGAPPGLSFKLDARTLKLGDSFTFSTDAGDLDCLGVPSGTGGFEGLAGAAVVMDIGAQRVPVASLDDLIAMKRASGRPKDLIELEVLGALRDEIDEQQN